MPGSRPSSHGCRCRTRIFAAPSTGRTRDRSSVLAHYRQMLAFRRQHPALVSGDIRFLEPKAQVLAFVRTAAKERLLCVFNFAGKAAKWTDPKGLGACS